MKSSVRVEVVKQLFIGLSLLSFLPVLATAQEPQDGKLVLDPDLLICALDNAYGVASGNSFSPEPRQYGYTEGPKVLKIPAVDDRLPEHERGWIHWKEDATTENGFFSTLHGFNGSTFEWHLNYTFISTSGVPVSVSLKRICSELDEIISE